MKIIQSFWSGNQTKFTNNYGWYSYKYNWLSWVLSCIQLVKFHKDVELYTDKFGYDILIKKLKLPYTKVHVVLDELNNYDSNLWAIAKIRTFQLQKEPFIHVDGDVYVWESLSIKFEKSNLVAQNLEITTDYYRKGWESIHGQLDFLPTEMHNYNSKISNYACNMGIVGGNNLDFFKNYTNKSIDFVNKNAKSINDLENLNFNIFFEQVLFHEMSSIYNQKIDFYFNYPILDYDYKFFGDFDKIPNIKYIHLLGDYKRNPFYCKSMEVYVMKYYPEFYTRLTKLINKSQEKKTEIDFLDYKINIKLNDEFVNELKSSNQIKDNYFLLKRDLYNEGLPLFFDSLINQNKNFWITSLKGYSKKYSEKSNSSILFLRIKELNLNPNIYYLDEIDEIILSEIKKPIQYFEFLTNIVNHLEEDDEQSIKEFTYLINQTLRKYIILKIISIYI